MAQDLQEWALPHLRPLLPLDDGELKQIVSYTATLDDAEAAQHLREMLGETPESTKFIAAFNERRHTTATHSAGATSSSSHSAATPAIPHDSKPKPNSAKHPPPIYAPPAGPPPSATVRLAPPPTQPRAVLNAAPRRPHTNAVIEAGHVRSRDEQEVQQQFQTWRYELGIYNDDIEPPEHEGGFYCSCISCRWQNLKFRRLGVQQMWSDAVKYPGEKSYNDSKCNNSIFTNNPYRFRVVSIYGYNAYNPGWYSMPRPISSYHARAVHQTIDLNNSLNQEAQAKVDAQEPKHSIWADDALELAVTNMTLGDKKAPMEKGGVNKSGLDEKRALEKRASIAPSVTSEIPSGSSSKPSKLTSFRKSLGIKNSEERAVAKVEKAVDKGQGLRNDIIREENGRWPDEQARQIVATYQAKIGMTQTIADYRAHKPIQYLHLLRAGYFEPIPVAWADNPSNPLKFSIDSGSGWRGITPQWRGYEDTAEERCFWTINHRATDAAQVLKPDFLSIMDQARRRMQTVTEPPPLYASPDDTCFVQHTAPGGEYSKQIIPGPFVPSGRPELPTDDTMILLDCSGSMDFDPVRPIYDQYLITGWGKSPQPKNKDVSKAVIRRFVDALSVHDKNFKGYDMVGFSNHAQYLGTVNHQNLDATWRNIRFAGGTRVMSGWREVQRRHFSKHAQSATYDPVWGWQAGPDTQRLNLLLLLDGEATDMDEFELDLLACADWAHVTCFLVGSEGCVHHHRHALELTRIATVNHNLQFVDGIGSMPERFVTHELLKRHLGYELSYGEFQQLEELPPYSE